MSPSDEGVSTVIHGALSHKMRRRILLILRTRNEPMAPVDLEPHIEGNPEQKKLSKISYHVRELQKVGLVTLVKTEPVRGTTKHFYSLNKSFTADLLNILALDAIAELLENAASDATEELREQIIEVLTASGRPIRSLIP
jgi:DNA-binding transcriptional ArsR family regulator